MAMLKEKMVKSDVVLPLLATQIPISLLPIYSPCSERQQKCDSAMFWVMCHLLKPREALATVKGEFGLQLSGQESDCGQDITLTQEQLESGEPTLHGPVLTSLCRRLK
ncbi:hypothetical protein AAFF_G00152110 [Aldrovandia affinis]|uniref:Uncharacterized protein n=1 Tax=Aldrovandia affinis TaxID=143900 RepID=A0AAD7RNT1_9TELE|nr:hypothetical protein AAFF_G00152110 [Aldrovandia affinis]